MDALIISKTGAKSLVKEVTEIKFLDHVTVKEVKLKSTELENINLNEMTGNLTIVGNNIFTIRPDEIESLNFVEPATK